MEILDANSVLEKSKESLQSLGKIILERKELDPENLVVVRGGLLYGDNDENVVGILLKTFPGYYDTHYFGVVEGRDLVIAFDVLE